MTVVIDTNVLVSGLIQPDNTPGRIIDLLRADEITLAIDDRIYDEYSEVLSREHFSKYFSAAEKNLILDFISHDSVRVLCTKRIPDLPDQDDACFLEVALTANVPLITGNIRHYPEHQCQGVQVITPGQFVEHFNQ